MARLTLRPMPAIALPGFTIRPGVTIRPELVLRTARRGGPRWKGTRLRELLARGPATGRLAPPVPVRSVRPGRAPVIAGVLALAVATALVVAVIVRRRRAAATKTEASVAAAAEAAAEPALAAARGSLDAVVGPGGTAPDAEPVGEGVPAGTTPADPG